MFKKGIVILVLTLTGCFAKAQNRVYLPYLHLLKTDSTYFALSDLKRNEKVMVIYFSPDCSHCQLYTKELLKHMNVLANTQILMVTWASLPTIRGFYKDYDLAKYPNFIVTTEGYSYNLYRFFNVKTTPYTAIYDRSHRLTQVFEKSPVIDSLLAAIKK